MYEKRRGIFCVGLISGIVFSIRYKVFGVDRDFINTILVILFFTSIGCYLWVTRHEEDDGGGGGGDGGF